MKIIVIFLAIIFPLVVFSQEIEDFTLDEVNEEIYIKSIDSGFRKEIVIVGSANDEDKWFRIYFGELDEVEVISATWENHRGKSKPIDVEGIYESAVRSYTFYSGTKALNIPIHKTSKFVVRYTVENPYMIFLSHLWMGEIYPTKKITKKITLPPNLQLHYDLPDVNYINPVVETKDSINDYTVYTFSSNPEKGKEREFSMFHYSTSEKPNIRIIITKNDETPEICLNNLIIKMNDSVCRLNDESKRIIDSLTHGLATEKEIARKCYKFLQQSFNYIDIENGIDALRPTDVNLTLTKRIGDCKDMSMLLISMLRYKKVDACYAIVPSTKFSFDMDFPCVASANHVVCALKTEGNYIVLDATDRLCEFGEPSMHTQGETMFIVSEDGYEKYNIPVTNPEKNLINISLELEHGQNLFGTCTVTLKGKSKNYYKYLSGNEIASRQNELIGYFIEMFSGSATRRIDKTIENDSSLIINTYIEINKSYLSEINRKLYLTPSFIPRPYFFDVDDDDLETKIILPFAFETRVECNIQFSEGWVMPEVSNTKLSAGDFSGFFAIEHNKKDRVQISSGFRCNKIEYLPDEIDSLRKIISDFEKLYRHAIKFNQIN